MEAWNVFAVPVELITLLPELRMSLKPASIEISCSTHPAVSPENWPIIMKVRGSMRHSAGVINDREIVTQDDFLRASEKVKIAADKIRNASDHTQSTMKVLLQKKLDERNAEKETEPEKSESINENKES